MERHWRDGAPWVTEDPRGSLARWASGVPQLAGHVLFSTSGTAGVAKRVALSKEALRVSAAAVNRHLGVGSGSVWGLALPVRHVGGFGVWLRAREAGCALEELAGKWNAGAFAAWVAERGVTHVSLVPTQVHDLVAAELRAPECVRAVVTGGGRLGRAAGQRARALGWPVLASYGLTEAGSQVATAGLDSLGPAYQPAPLKVLPHWQVCIGEGGRLWLRGEALFHGTVEGAEGRWVWRAREGEWHATRDRAEATTDGWLTPLGRLDSLVKVLGELVDPEAVEERLAELAGPAVGRRLAVVAVADERAGHRLMLVAEEGVRPRELARVLHDYHRGARGFERVGGPLRVPSLPRGPLGKLLRGEIAAKINAGAFRG